MLKNPARGHKKEKHHPEWKSDLYHVNGNDGTRKYSEKRHIQINKRKKERNTCDYRGARISKSTIERRGAASMKA